MDWVRAGNFWGSVNVDRGVKGEAGMLILVVDRNLLIAR